MRVIVAAAVHRTQYHLACRTDAKNGTTLEAEFPGIPVQAVKISIAAVTGNIDRLRNRAVDIWLQSRLH